MRPPTQRNPYSWVTALACLVALGVLCALIVATSEPVPETYVGEMR